MTDRELSFKIRNINQAFTAEVKIKVSALGLGMTECSGCSNEEEKPIRLISERIGQGPEFTKYYCLEHAKQSLNQLSGEDFEMENKVWVLNTLGGYLQEDKKAVEKHVEKENPDFVDPSGQFAYRKEDKPLCLNTECQAEINNTNKAFGYMSCEKCQEKVKEKLKSGEWERTTRGGWVKKEDKELERKTDPSLEDIGDKDDNEEVDKARKRLEEEVLKNGSGEGSGFNIPLKKVTDEKIIEGVKQQLAEEQNTPEEKSSTRPATEEEVKEAVEKHNEEQSNKFRFVATTENLIKGWGLLTEEERNTLNSKQKWNLREKRKRQMIKEGLLDPNTGQLTSKLDGKDKAEIFEATKNQAGLKLDPSGTNTTGVKYVDKPETSDKVIVETADKEFRDFVEERACFHLKEKFWQFFNRKNIPHIEKNSHWFFYLNIMKKDKCLCECLNDIRQARTSAETNGKYNYKQMYLDMKRTKEIDYKNYRQELLKSAKENRELKVVIQKKTNENSKVNKALQMVYKKSKDDWTKISKLFLEHKPKSKDKNYETGR